MSQKFYAVKSGRNPGIYRSWEECKTQIDHYTNAKFKKFSTLEEAESFVNGNVSRDVTSHSSSNWVSRERSSCSRYQPYSNNGTRHRTKNVGSSRNGLANFSTESSSSHQADSEDKTPVKHKEFEAVVYTDGCCISNGSKKAIAGIGVFWGPSNPNNLSEPVVGRRTNNSAEIEACCRALEQAKTMGVKDLEIRTDSKFLINCMTKWIAGWKRNGWMTKNDEPVKNILELKRLDECREGVRVKWTHVAGHSGIFGNEEADRLAKEGALKYRRPR